MPKCGTLQPLLHQAVAAPGNSAKPPFPPTLKHLMEVADTPPTGRDEQMSAGYSNLTVARYFLHHADVPQVRQLLSGVDSMFYHTHLANLQFAH